MWKFHIKNVILERITAENDENGSKKRPKWLIFTPKWPENAQKWHKNTLKSLINPSITRAGACGSHSRSGLSPLSCSCVSFFLLYKMGFMKNLNFLCIKNWVNLVVKKNVLN
jgi:hypothetical protein